MEGFIGDNFARLAPLGAKSRRDIEAKAALADLSRTPE